VIIPTIETPIPAHVSVTGSSRNANEESASFVRNPR
jgi:hypothetical protein